VLGESVNELADMFGPDWQGWNDKELKEVQEPLDFLGINYYLRLVVCDDSSAGPVGARVVLDPEHPRTAMDWEIWPQGLIETLGWLKDRYGDLPLYITENGAAFEDEVGPEGVVEDGLRIKYLREHLWAARAAIDKGVDLRGYYLWSLVDNFEWQQGFSKRFGIVHVDFKSQRRVPKASARFYSDVIRTQGAVLEGGRNVSSLSR
jgi:beta-glucosidase